MFNRGISIEEIQKTFQWTRRRAKEAILRSRKKDAYSGYEPIRPLTLEQREERKLRELKEGAEWLRLKAKYGNGKKQPRDPKTGQLVSRPRPLPGVSMTPPVTTQAIKDEFNRRLAEGRLIKGDGTDTFGEALLNLDMGYEHFASLIKESKRTVEYWRRDNIAPPCAWTLMWLMETIPELRILLESRWEIRQDDGESEGRL